MNVGDEVRIVDTDHPHNGRRAVIKSTWSSDWWAVEISSGPDTGTTAIVSMIHVEPITKPDPVIESKPDPVNSPHEHYFKEWHGKIDVYRVCTLFAVGNPAITHAIKKLLCAGERGSKSILQDWREAIDSINRALEMAQEDRRSEARQEETEKFSEILNTVSPSGITKKFGGRYESRTEI